MHPRARLRMYAGVAWTAPRLNLGGAMQSSPADGASAGTTLLIPSAGVILAPRVGELRVRPTLRAGAGIKRYRFGLAGQPDAVSTFTGDLGLGLMGGDDGPVGISAEARWLPSRFSAHSLPVDVIGNAGQTQNDWIFQLAARFRP